MPKELASEISRQFMLTLLEAGKFHTEFTEEMPTKWHPDKVENPETGFVFTEAECLDFIETTLKSGHPIETIDLSKPKGKKGYVMKVKPIPGGRVIYIKLQIGVDVLIGRSFHY